MTDMGGDGPPESPPEPLGPPLVPAEGVSTVSVAHGGPDEPSRPDPTLADRIAADVAERLRAMGGQLRGWELIADIAHHAVLSAFGCTCRGHDGAVYPEDVTCPVHGLTASERSTRLLDTLTRLESEALATAGADSALIATYREVWGDRVRPWVLAELGQGGG